MTTPALSPSPDIAGHPARVLIVDDDRLNRQLLEVMLEPEGFLLQSAASGEEALALVAQGPPDLILLDVMMPGMDGYQVAARIKGNAATRNIPVIMITALGDRSAKMRGLSAGAEDFLTEPVDRAELCMRVRNLLRLKAYSDYHDTYNLMLEGEVGARTAALAESEARFRQIAESIPEFFFLVDPEFRQTLYASPAYEQIYGRSCESLYADPRSWGEATHPDDRERLRHAMAPQGTLVPFDVEHRIVRPDGSVREIRVRGRPVYNGAGEVHRLAGIAEDVTDQRSLEAQVRQANKLDSIGRLASGVAHDFNNLLTVILASAEYVRDDLAAVNGHGEDLGEIVKAARRAAGLTKQLLAFGRAQALHAAPLDVNGLIKDMTGMLDRLIGEQVEVNLNLAPALSLALVDRGQLEQVVMNLVVNARDAMPGGGSVTIQTADVCFDDSAPHEEAIVPGRYVMLAITDTGVGMTAETRQRLFEPFYTTKEIGKGTGLGLSTTYGIVKQSKGYIWVSSEPGRGATFTVHLPCADRDLPMQAPDTAVTAPVARPSETVLLVEDEPVLRRLAKRILTKAGYQVLEAENGNAAELVFADHADVIVLVITDVIMPGCGGPELLRRLLARAPTLKMLYMSGYAEQPAGLDRPIALIQKPFTTAELQRHVRDALDH